MATRALKTVEAVIDDMDQKREDNLRIWKGLSKTDPTHTKQFSRAGGFHGTAVKPMWVIKRLTEEFGPCGKGWGINEPRFEVVQGAPGETLVYCTVSCWHGAPENVLYGVGGDRVAVMRSSGKPFFDDEAFKKAFTDAVNNAFKFIGVAADIHMGLFDDSKYVAEVREEFHPKADVTTGETGPRKTHLDGPYDTIPKLEKAAREFARTLRGIGTLDDFEEWKKDKDVIAFVEQCKRDLPGWWFVNHPESPADFTPLSAEVSATLRGLKDLAGINEGTNA